jgi:hypothetical protein
MKHLATEGASVSGTTISQRPIDPLDYLEIDTLLSDEERLIRDTVRQWVSDRILPDVGTWFEEGYLPMELAPELGKLGLLGMHLTGYGCAGTSAVAYGLGGPGRRPPPPPPPRRRRPATPASARSSPSRGRSPCSRSGGGARRRRRASGCRGWQPARRSAASV